MPPNRESTQTASTIHTANRHRDSNADYQASKGSLFVITRNWLSKRVDSGTETVVKFQQWCGVKLEQQGGKEQNNNGTTSNLKTLPPSTHVYSIKPDLSSSAQVHPVSESNIKCSTSQPKYIAVYPKAWYHYHFVAASAVGNELFYIFFLPILFWFLDLGIGRKVILLWFTNYYIGQFFKDYYRLPRPPCPPCAKLENHYEAEYGFPSTHALIGIAMSAYLFYLTYGVYNYSFITGLICVIFWSGSISLSRLYVGVHSPADIVGGLLIGLVTTYACVVWGEQFDDWLITTSVAPLYMLAVAVPLILAYPAPKKWTNAYGDTVLIIGTAFGIFCAYVPFMPTSQVYTFTVNTDSMQTIINSIISIAFSILLRVVIGYGSMFAARTCVKKVLMTIVPPLVLNKKQLSEVQHDRSLLGKIYAVEIPIKFIVYACVGFNATFTAPQIFRLLNA